MRRRTKKAQPPIYSIYAIYDNDIEKFILECIGDVFNAPYDIETLQSEQYTVYEKETQPDYIPFDFWNYGYKITDLPEHLQQRYERYTHD